MRRRKTQCLPCNVDWSDAGEGRHFGVSPVVGRRRAIEAPFSGAQQQRRFQAPSPIFRRHLRLQAPVQVPLQASLEAPFATPFQASFRCHVRRTPKAPIQALHQALFKAGFSYHSRRRPWKRHSGAVHSNWRAPLRLFLPLDARQLQSLECYRC